MTKSKDPGVKKQSKNPSVDKSPSGKKKSLAEVECYVCGEFGHYARDCKDRKVAAKALVTKSNFGAINEEGYEKDDEEDSVSVTSSEAILFSKDDVLLGSQASVNVFCNPRLLKNVRKSDRQVLLNGVQSGAAGVRITQEGDFDDVGKVYFSADATANILSYAVMVDEGNAVSYDQLNDRFELRPVSSNLVYSFCRKNVRGSEGRFYCCDVRSMIGSCATDYSTTMRSRVHEHALIETESDNMSKYTKREIDGAYKARELLAKMVFPPVSKAIGIATRGVNFTVTASVTRTPSVRTVRIEDDPIHTICCVISAVLICKLITLLSFSIIPQPFHLCPPPSGFPFLPRPQ